MRQSSTSICYLGAHPDEGSVSMDVYRQKIWNEVSDEERDYCTVWPHEVGLMRKAHRAKRAFSKYLSYPLRVFRLRDYQIYHLLDHSSAHLLNWLPKDAIKIVTVHDLIPLRYPGHLTAKQVERFQQMVNNLTKADHLICNSEYTKQEVIELLGIAEESVTVVHLGVTMPPPETYRSPVVAELRERGASHVVLSVGSILGRKNLSILPRCFEDLKRDHPDSKVALLRVGAALPGELRHELMNVLGSDFFLEAGRLKENELFGCYADCDSVVVPSLYEGFGLPVLEAFAFGKPVVASNRASLPEVGGDLAYYFDPDKAEEMSNALWASLETETTSLKRDQRVERARELSWKRHYEGCRRVYERLTAQR